MLNWKIKAHDLSDIESIDSEDENEPVYEEAKSREDRLAKQKMDLNLKKLKENAKAISAAKLDAVKEESSCSESYDQQEENSQERPPTSVV
jgi:hypothetical protein